MNIKQELKSKLSEAYDKSNLYIVNVDDVNTVGRRIKSKDPKAVLKVVDDKKVSSSTGMGGITTESDDIEDKSYNIYAICTKSTGKTSGDDSWERCVKGLKHKEGYKLGESVNPKMTKREIIETVLKTSIPKKKVIKVSDILK